jgi:hypothetical protein
MEHADLFISPDGLNSLNDLNDLNSSDRFPEIYFDDVRILGDFSGHSFGNFFAGA